MIASNSAVRSFVLAPVNACERGASKCSRIFLRKISAAALFAADFNKRRKPSSIFPSGVVCSIRALISSLLKFTALAEPANNLVVRIPFLA